jgi:hypothetical protein
MEAKMNTTKTKKHNENKTKKIKPTAKNTEQKN